MANIAEAFPPLEDIEPHIPFKLVLIWDEREPKGPLLLQDLIVFIKLSDTPNEEGKYPVIFTGTHRLEGDVGVGWIEGSQRVAPFEPPPKEAPPMIDEGYRC